MMHNFILIEKLNISFTRGLQVYTGETGAGKSLIVDAMALLAGERATGPLVRAGAEAATLAVQVDGTHLPELRKELIDQGLMLPESTDGIVIQRVLSVNGRSRCRVNGHLVPLATLRRLSREWLDFCTQESAWFLLTAREQQEWLDGFGGEQLLKYRRVYDKVYAHWKDWLEKSPPLAVAEAEKRYDSLTFQLETISNVDPQESEDTRLLQEKEKLLIKKKRQEKIAIAYAALHDEGRGLDGLREAMFSLQELGEEDAVIQSLVVASERAEEVARHIARRRAEETPVYDRLAEIEDRFAQLRQLLRSYGCSCVDEVLQKRQEWTKKLIELDAMGEYRTRWLKEKVKIEKQMEKAADDLTMARRGAAVSLQARVASEMRALAMPHARLVVDIEARDRWYPEGQDRVIFQWSANPGEELAPLSRTVSGGERARVVLALKTALAPVKGAPTLLFDEIDTGISGRVAQAVAERLAFLAQRVQVICVTHLAQVASMADRHHSVSKIPQGERMVTVVTLLDEQGRQRELARLLGGASITTTTRAHAREMLRMAQQHKADMQVGGDTSSRVKV